MFDLLAGLFACASRVQRCWLRALRVAWQSWGLVGVSRGGPRNLQLFNTVCHVLKVNIYLICSIKEEYMR